MDSMPYICPIKAISLFQLKVECRKGTGLYTDTGTILMYSVQSVIHARCCILLFAGKRLIMPGDRNGVALVLWSCPHVLS